MDERLAASDLLLGVFSDDYIAALYSSTERWAAYWDDPVGRKGFLVPVEVQSVKDWPPLTRPLKRLSLVGLTEVQADEALRKFLAPPRPPSVRPDFPGSNTELDRALLETTIRSRKKAEQDSNVNRTQSSRAQRDEEVQQMRQSGAKRILQAAGPTSDHLPAQLIQELRLRRMQETLDRLKLCLADCIQRDQPALFIQTALEFQPTIEQSQRLSVPKSNRRFRMQTLRSSARS